MELTTQHLIALLPLLVTCATIVVVMLAIAWRRHHSQTFVLSVVGLHLALLSIIAWLVGLVQPVFTVMGNEFSWKDLILIAGGLFLVWKATKEIHHTVDPTPTHDVMDKKDVVIANAGAAIVQIILLDIVFSIDSILTAVGMTTAVAVPAVFLFRLATFWLPVAPGWAGNNY